MKINLPKISFSHIVYALIIFIFISTTMFNNIKARNRFNFILDNDFDYIEVFIQTIGNDEKSFSIGFDSFQYFTIKQNLVNVEYANKKEKTFYDKVFLKFEKDNKNIYLLLYYKEGNKFIPGKISFNKEFDLYPEGKHIYINDFDGELNALIDKLINTN